MPFLSRTYGAVSLGHHFPRAYCRDSPGLTAAKEHILAGGRDNSTAIVPGIDAGDDRG
jgi:hypothetical protein